MITQGQNNAYGRARILVIGLDAATFDVLDPLFAAEKCPNLARLKHEGVVATLQSTVPPLACRLGHNLNRLQPRTTWRI